MSMEEFLGGLIVLDIVMGVKSCHELSNDMLSIMVELTFPVWVCPDNCSCIFCPYVEPVRIQGNLGFGLSCPLCQQFKVVTKANDFIVSSDSGEMVFDQHCKVNLLVCQDISPEHWREVWTVLLGLKTLEGSFDINDVVFCNRCVFCAVVRVVSLTSCHGGPPPGLSQFQA